MKTDIEIMEKQTTRFLSWGGLIGSFPARLQAERWIQQETETVAREMLAEVPSEIKYALSG